MKSFFCSINIIKAIKLHHAAVIFCCLDLLIAQN